MKIKVFNILLTHDNSQTIILSTSKTKIVLPMFQIESPKQIREEIRYLTKNLFNDPDLSHPELVDSSFMEIHNKLLIDYVSSIPEYNYNTEEDLCIYSAVILSKKAISGLHWVPLKNQSETSLENIDTVDLLIDYTIKNIIL